MNERIGVFKVSPSLRLDGVSRRTNGTRLEQLDDIGGKGSARSLSDIRAVPGHLNLIIRFRREDDAAKEKCNEGFHFHVAIFSGFKLELSRNCKNNVNRCW